MFTLCNQPIIEGPLSSLHLRDGTFMWKMTAVDILKSHLQAKLGWEAGDIILDSTIKFQQNFIQAVSIPFTIFYSSIAFPKSSGQVLRSGSFFLSCFIHFLYALSSFSCTYLPPIVPLYHYSASTLSDII